MGKISLNGLEFFAYHGFYDAEREVGNKYRVDIKVYTDFVQAGIEDSLRKTVNYEQLYHVVKTEMGKPSKLLETIAMRIANTVLQSFSSVNKVKVKLQKFNPPIGGICKAASISYTQKRSTL